MFDLKIIMKSDDLSMILDFMMVKNYHERSYK